MSADKWSWTDNFNWYTGSNAARLELLATKNPELVFDTLQGQIPALSAFAKDPAFKQNLHKALQDPEFRDYLAKGAEGEGLFSEESLNSLLSKNSPAAQYIGPMMNLIANDPNFDFKDLDELGDKYQKHQKLEKEHKLFQTKLAEEEKAFLKTNPTDAEKEIWNEQKAEKLDAWEKKLFKSQTETANTLHHIGINVGVGAYLNPEMLMNFLTNIFEQGPAVALQGLIDDMKSLGAPQEALDGFKPIMGFVSNTLHSANGEPGSGYYEYGKRYFPEAKRAFEEVSKNFRDAMGGDLTSEAANRIAAVPTP